MLEVSVSFCTSLRRKVAPNRHLRGAQKRVASKARVGLRNSDFTSLCRKMIPNGHPQTCLKWHWSVVRMVSVRYHFRRPRARKGYLTCTLRSFKQKPNDIQCRKCPFLFLEPVQENGNRHLRDASKSLQKSSSKISHIEDKFASVCSIFPDPVQ